FRILAPNGIGYDARWYHLPIAEHYAAHGGVGRFDDGWYAGTLPHLASFLYTWAYLLPRPLAFHQISLAQHVEFVVFLATLAQIPILVRRLLPDTRATGSWCALFLFPGLFVFDSNLIAGADHVAALFAIPIFLALLRARRSLEPRYCVL